jgi:hypothetical protein
MAVGLTTLSTQEMLAHALPTACLTCLAAGTPHMQTKRSPLLWIASRPRHTQHSRCLLMPYSLPAELC